MESTGWEMPTHILATAGIVLNEKDEVLLVKTARDGWAFPGGQVEVGENVMDALKREVMEETGVAVEVGEVFCISSNTGKHPGYNGVKEVPTKILLDFICRAAGGTPRPSEENSASVYFPKDRVPELIGTPANLERYHAYLAYTGRPTYLAFKTKPAYLLEMKRTV